MAPIIIVLAIILSIHYSNSYAAPPDLGYVLEFEDNFDGNTLDRSKWCTRLIEGQSNAPSLKFPDVECQRIAWEGKRDHLNDEMQRYRDNYNHVVGNGYLNLVAYKRATTNGGTYESGMIRSKYATKYGYYETRVKMPKGVGAWTAFWLRPDYNTDMTLGWPPEIDIFEYVNNGVENKANMLHMNVVNKGVQTNQILSHHPDFDRTWNDFYLKSANGTPIDFHAGWHVIGLEWMPEGVKYYVDGVLVVTRTYKWLHNDGTEAPPAHVILNYAIGGQWAGRYGVDDAVFPQGFLVDYVRVYKRAQCD